MKTIFIIEDDLWLAEEQARSLVKEGYEVELLPHAHSAIQKIDEKIPDCIILDVLLPGGTGISLLNELQSYPDTGSIPVILCTSLASNLSLKELIPYGVHRILDKTTMTPSDIISAVRSCT